jgi:hypothetical protein
MVPLEEVAVASKFTNASAGKVELFVGLVIVTTGGDCAWRLAAAKATNPQTALKKKGLYVLLFIISGGY